MKRILAAIVLGLLHAVAAAATLEIVSGAQHLTFSQTQLLSRRDIQTLSIADSVYKQRLTRFKAIPIASLFRGLVVPRLAVIQCNGTDGFSAILQQSRLLSTDRRASKAYLAIEDPKHPWPHLAGKTTSAGPFYLVWTDPQASAIGREEWPYQIASFHIVSDAHTVFSKAYPAENAPLNVQSGFQVFRKNCFACHKMNGDGAGSIGPDLNRPMNPTAYFDSKALARLIRNPASVRTWPGMIMRGFSEAAIPDTELADLIAYLRYMGKGQGKP